VGDGDGVGAVLVVACVLGRSFADVHAPVVRSASAITGPASSRGGTPDLLDRS
jgi:hypothetical protein